MVSRVLVVDLRSQVYESFDDGSGSCAGLVDWCHSVGTATN